MKRRVRIVMVAVSVASLCLLAPGANAAAPACQISDPFCYQPAAQQLVAPLQTVSEPTIAAPDWLGGGQ